MRRRRRERRKPSRKGYRWRRSESRGGSSELGAEEAQRGIRLGSNLIMDVYRLSRRGTTREVNEDSILVLPLARSNAVADGIVWLFAVADGMGGQEHGEVASQVAVGALSEHLAGNLRELTGADVERRAQVLHGAFVRANEKVRAEEHGSGAASMGTTLVVALLCGADLYIGNVGDSRCYLFGDGEIHRATRDDSVVQQMIDANLITEAEAKSHPKRSLITKALGALPEGELLPVIVHRGDVGHYDHLLLCSDGLHAFVTDAGIAKTVYEAGDVASAATALADLAVKGGGSDDVSIILARFSRPEPREQSFDADE